MTLHQILPGLTSQPTFRSSTPTASSNERSVQVPNDNAVSVDATHLPAQEPKALCHAEGKQSSDLSTAVKDQVKNTPGLQQHIEHITMDSDRLTKENNRLSKENDRLATGYNKLEERYNQLKEDNDQIGQEIRQLKKQLAIVDVQSKSNPAETQKLINHLTTENGQLKEACKAAIELLKAQPIMQDMTNKLVKEKEELEEKSRNTSYTTAEMKMQHQQLQEQADNLANEVKMLRKENAELQKGFSKAGQDAPTMDMAKLLKRYYEIEEQFGQMKKDIKQDVKNALAKKEKKIVQQVQEHIVDNEKKIQETLVESEKKMGDHVEKRLGESEKHVQTQVKESLMENEKRIQERLGVNEVNIWRQGQGIQQNVQDIIAKHEKQVRDRLGACEVKTQDLEQEIQQNIAKHDQQVQDRLRANEVKTQELEQKIENNIAKHDKQVQDSLQAKEAKIQQDVMDIIDERVQKVYEIQKIGETARVVCGDTVNEQGYFTRLMPLKEVPDNLIQIGGSYGRFIVYVERKKIAEFENFKTFIKDVWEIDWKPYEQDFFYNGGRYHISSSWITLCAEFKRISIIPSPNDHRYNRIDCTS